MKRTTRMTALVCTLVVLTLLVFGCDSGSATSPGVSQTQSISTQTPAAPAEFWTVLVASYGATPAGRSSAAEHQASLAAKGLAAEWADSSNWSSLRSGYAVVFVGRYDSEAAAKAQVASVRAKGQKGCYVRSFTGVAGAPAVLAPSPPPAPTPPAAKQLPGDTNGDGKYVYPEIPPGANPSPEWTGKNTEWNVVPGYTRKDGTYVQPHWRRTK